MKLEGGQISAFQLLVLLAGFIVTSGPLVGFITPLVRQNAWLAVLTGAAAMIPAVIVYVRLATLFGGRNLIEINELVYGRAIGAAVSLVYMFSFTLTLIFTVFDVGIYFSLFIMPDTTSYFFQVVFTAVCALAAAGGIEVIARTGLICTAISLTTVVIVFLLSLKNMNIGNFLPLLAVPLQDFLHSSHIIAAISFGETVVFLMIAAAVKDRQNIPKNVLGGQLLGAVGVLVGAILVTAVVGPAQAILVNPVFEAVRMIDVAKVLTRMEVLFIAGNLLFQFVKGSVLFYGIVLGLAQVLRLRTYLPLVIPCALIVMNLAACVYRSFVDYYATSVSTTIIYYILPTLILPALTLLVAVLRGLNRTAASPDGDESLRQSAEELQTLIGAARSVQERWEQERDRLR